MNKSEALSRRNIQIESPLLVSANTRFANITGAGEKSGWRIEIPVLKVVEEIEGVIHLLLFDNRNNRLHHLAIPNRFLRESVIGLTLRESKSTSGEVVKICLKLSANEKDLFEDKATPFSYIPFGQFLQS